MKDIFYSRKFKCFTGIFSIVILFAFFSCQETKKSYNKDNERLPAPTKLMDKFSYMAGHAMGTNFERDSLYNINYDYVIQAMKDVLAKRELLLSRAELDSINQIMQVILNERNKNRLMREKMFVQNAQKESFEFLQNNKKNPGVVVLPSGLQYKVIKKGSGSSPKPNDYLKISAKAMFLDGKELQSSEQDKGPIYVQLKEGLLKSWLEALSLMNKGAKWTLYSPSEFAFGDGGTEEVPPNKLIVFELELLDFQVKPYPDMPKFPSMPKQQ